MPAYAARVCWKAARAGEGGMTLKEPPYVESKYLAPVGLLATAEEKAELAAVGIGPDGGLRREAVTEEPTAQ